MRIIAGMVLSGLVLLSQARAATDVPPPIDLGSLGGGQSFAAAINDRGQVVGTSWTAGGKRHAFSWTAEGGMVDLGTLGGPESWATSVNEAGQVIGFGTNANGEDRSFSWTAAGGMVDLGTLGGGNTFAHALNDAGQVVGRSSSANENFRAFSWTRAKGMVDLGSLGHGGEAYGINACGQVVGWTYLPDGVDGPYTYHAFSWTRRGGMVDLDPGSVHGALSEAYHLNDAGMVVGIVGSRHQDSLFAWTASAGMTVLGSLGGINVAPCAVNSRGRVAGTSTLDPSSYFGVPGHAFTWTKETGMVDLRTLGGSESVAQGMNAGGQIVGHSSLTGDAESHAFSWTPEGGMVDLGTGKFSGSAASAVNDLGQVAGTATDSQGSLHAVLWGTGGPRARVRALAARVAEVAPQGWKRGLLLAMLETASQAIARHQDRAACAELQVFAQAARAWMKATGPEELLAREVAGDVRALLHCDGRPACSGQGQSMARREDGGDAPLASH